VDPELEFGGHMVSAQRDPGAQTLVRGAEAKTFFAVAQPEELANLS